MRSIMLKRGMLHERKGCVREMYINLLCPLLLWQATEPLITTAGSAGCDR